MGMKLRDVYPDLPIKGLSLKQPYASLMLYGKIETRVWSTSYRGLVLICSSQFPYTDVDIRNISGAYAKDVYSKLFRVKQPCGYAIAVGRLVRVEQLNGSLDYPSTYVEVKRSERKLYGHYIDSVQKVVPFPVKGKQGYFDLNEEVIEQIVLI